MSSSSRSRLSPLSVAAHGSAYLLTHRSWTSRIGTGFRKCNFSRPRFLVVTRPASSSTFRCFMTPKRVIGSRCSSALRLCPSSLKSSSSRLLRVGSASALNTPSMAQNIRDHLVTCQGTVPIERHGELERVQVKYARSDGSTILVKCYSHSLTNGRVKATKLYT